MAAQRRNAEETRQDFEIRMLNMVSRLAMTDTIFFYKRVCKAMAMEVEAGPFAYSLEFPQNFLSQHAEKIGEDVTSVTTNSQQTWRIKITIRTFEGPKVRVFAYGLGGWKDFVKDNHIKVGDVLVFKLLRWSHFEVVISRSPVKVHSNVKNAIEDQDNAHQASL